MAYDSENMLYICNFHALFHMLEYFLKLMVVPAVETEVPALGLGYALAKVGGEETNVSMVRF